MLSFAKKLYLSVLICFGFGLIAVSQTKYSNEFLNIGVGARSLAMSKSTLASGKDITSTYWNPAGLAAMDKDFALGLMHLEYSQNIGKFDFISAATSVLDTNSTLGITMLRMGVDDIPNTLNLYDNEGNINYDRITKFSVADYAFLFTYSRKMPVKGLTTGANVKVIRRIIGQFASAWGFGFDAGIRYQTGEWSFAAVGYDITSTFNAWSFNEALFKDVFDSTGNEMPQNSLEVTMPRLAVGAARNIKVFTHFDILIEANADIFLDGQRADLLSTGFATFAPHFGIEMNYDNSILFRVGMGDIQRQYDYNGAYTDSRPTLGVGLRSKYFEIDYALSDFGRNSNTFMAHIFSLNIAF